MELQNGDQDDTQEIFEECLNTVGITEQTKEIPNDLNVESRNPNEEQQQKENVKYLKDYKPNNNQHIVPVGIVIVLITIYLGMVNVQKCLVNCVENTTPQENQQVQQENEKLKNYLQKPDILRNTEILERLLEYKDICKDLEIFTKNIEEIELNNCEVEGMEEHGDNDDVNTNDILKDIEVTKIVNEEGSSSSSSNSGSGSGSSEDGGSGSASGSGHGCGKSTHHKHKKSKYSIKTTNTKNGFNKHNKSSKAKYQNKQKKELNLNKKNSTAEPIIYLFALVFIYLLLKAASDINQHYKSQNKSDKRLRRCSLQSYAQAHRPDRRASKELALKQKQQLKLQQQQQQQQRLKTFYRSTSQDQPNYSHNQHTFQSQHLMETSAENCEPQILSASNSPVRSKFSYSNNWQLLRQHTATQSVDNSDILNPTRGCNSEISSTMMARRCSVPAALSYQRHKFTPSVSPLSFVSDHVNNSNVSLSRRSSITSPLPLTMESIDSLIPETKRRVRMINRH
ncbi:uncharacterized protein ACRADG_011864 [Cochliomyia hominivorax]